MAQLLLSCAANNHRSKQSYKDRQLK